MSSSVGNNMICEDQQEFGEGMFDYYMRIYSKYEKIYGKIAVLLQNGSFYEVYGVDNESEKLSNANEVCEAMNLKVGKKDNKQLGNDRSNHLLGGFQPAQLEKYAPILNENGFTIILINQLGKDPKTNCFIRKVSRIISSSTYLDDVYLTNNKKQKNKELFAMYLEFNKKNELALVSMSSIDLSIGKCVLANVANSDIDKQKCIDESFRFIHSRNPIELLIYIDNELYKPYCERVLKDLNIDSLGCSCFIRVIPKEITKITYQSEFLKTIFNNKSSLGTMLDPIDYLDLSRYPSLTTCFVLLLKFAYEHDETIIKNVHYPVFWDDTNYLILENNAIYQLNISKTHNISESLIDLTDKTSTTIGRRLHKDRLLNPIVNVDILNERYSQIAWMLEGEGTGDKIGKFEELLKKILDIERLHRKIENGTVQPRDFVFLEKSYENIEKTMILLNEYIDAEGDSDKQLFKFWNGDMFEKFNNWRRDYNGIFNIRECDSKSEYNGKIFHTGIDVEIDSILEEIQNFYGEIYGIQKYISDRLRDLQGAPKSSRVAKKKTIALDDSSEEKEAYLIEFDKNSREEFSFTLSKTRESLFKKHIEKELEAKGWTNFERKTLSSGYRLTCFKLDEIGDTITELDNKLQSRILEVFYSKVKDLYEAHKGIFGDIVNFIGEIDWIKSAAKVAKEYHYTKPIISLETSSELKKKSFIRAKEMRHPMIERILDTAHYVPNDITIGLDCDGILLFGTNSSGKSSLMKSIGVNIIMAQSGMYVACSDFEYYPYNNIVTRITGDDNFSKGFSSFVVEMTELRTILNRSDANSLVLGDEICHGTEQVSGLALVASGIMELSRNKSSFIFATHLHQLSSLEEITSLANVKCKHLKVIYDEKEDSLVYDRKLEDGAGSDLYGIEVAKYIIHDQPLFLENAMKIRRKVLSIPKEVVASKKSKYNAKLVVDKCKVCGKDAVDTHHINFQCTADDSGTIETETNKFHKNVRANLVALCKRCHINVHHSIDGKQLVIEGYIQTTKGTILKWNVKDC